MKRKKPNWSKLKNEYISTTISQRALAAKYGLTYSTISRRATKERWKTLRDEMEAKTSAEVSQKIEQIIVKQEVDRMSKVLDLTDKLSEKLEKAIDELDVYIAKNKVKTKIVEYSEDGKGKPCTEVIEEKETITEYHSIVNTLALSQLANALKSIKEISCDIGAKDEEVEDSGLIEALQKRSEDLFESGDDSAMLPSVEG